MTIPQLLGVAGSFLVLAVVGACLARTFVDDWPAIVAAILNRPRS